MAETEKKVLVTLLKSKLGMVTSQNDELQGKFNAYIEQLKGQVEAVIETDEQQPGQLREMNSVLESVLEYLMRLNIEIKDAAVSGSPLQTADTQGITAVTLMSASTATLTSASTATQDVSGSESVTISQLVQRLNMVEMAMTGCQGGIRQSNTDLNQQMEARCQNLEDKLESLESKHASEVKKQALALEQKEETIKRLEALNDQHNEKLIKLEEKHKTRLDDVKKQLKEVKVEHQESKTENLQRLDDVKKQLHKLKTEEKNRMSGQMKDASHRVDYMNNPHQTPVAFTAEFPYPGTRPVTERSYIKDFTFMLCNIGACFNRDTGIFTAPRDGVCVTTVSLLQVGEGEVAVSVIHDRTGVWKRDVCLTRTLADNTSSCGVVVVEVKTGDTLGVWVRRVVGKPHLARPGTSFSCFCTDVGVPATVWPPLAGVNMGYKSLYHPRFETT